MDDWWNGGYVESKNMIPIVWKWNDDEYLCPVSISIFPSIIYILIYLFIIIFDKISYKMYKSEYFNKYKLGFTRIPFNFCNYKEWGKGRRK